MATAAIMTPKEFLATLSTATAIAVGAASTLILAGIVVVGTRLYSHRVRRLIVRRDPTRLLLLAAPEDATDIGGGVAAAPARSTARSVAAVDVRWARSRGYVTLSEYFHSLSVSAMMPGEAERWEKQALMSVAAALGMGEGGVGAVAGMILNAVPQVSEFASQRLPVAASSFSSVWICVVARGVNACIH
jgi:hypothetical protein